MKKNYQKPSIEVIKFKIKNQLLAGSGQSTNMSMDFGGDAYENEEGE